jgi:hypothetical protein
LTDEELEGVVGGRVMTASIEFGSFRLIVAAAADGWYAACATNGDYTACAGHMTATAIVSVRLLSGRSGEMKRAAQQGGPLLLRQFGVL